MISCTTTLDEEPRANLKNLNPKESVSINKSSVRELSYQRINKRLTKTHHKLRDEEFQINNTNNDKMM